VPEAATSSAALTEAHRQRDAHAAAIQLLLAENRELRAAQCLWQRRGRRRAWRIGYSGRGACSVGVAGRETAAAGHDSCRVARRRSLACCSNWTLFVA
jgi:hypothetical protein